MVNSRIRYAEATVEESWGGGTTPQHHWCTRRKPTSVTEVLLVSMGCGGLARWGYLTPESESRSIMSDCLQPHGLYAHGILQARILEWVALPFSRGTSPPRTRVSCTAGGFFTSWATREALQSTVSSYKSSPGEHVSFSASSQFIQENKQEIHTTPTLPPTSFHKG